MSKVPGVSSIFTNRGGVECMIGEPADGIPITIDGSRLGSASANVTFKGPALYARRTASPYKAVPFTNGTAIVNPTNTTNATIDVADADAVKFRVADSVRFFKISAGALDAQTKVISAIGAAGSGGAGYTRITLTGVWTTPPVASDILVVGDGAELSANAVVVLEDVVFDGDTDVLTAGFIEGAFLASAVQNATYFIASENQRINLVKM